MSRDFRRHPRIRTFVPAIALPDGRKIDAVVLNLGRGGAFILDDRRLASMEEFPMTLDLAEHGVVPVLARVVRRQAVDPRGLDVPGLGVKFVDLTPGALVALDRFARRLPARAAA